LKKKKEKSIFFVEKNKNQDRYIKEKRKHAKREKREEGGKQHNE
jgi:hypothetical protein